MTEAGEAPGKRAAQRAPWFLVLCALLWSSSGLFIKLSGWQPLSIISLRGLIAALVLLAFVALRRRAGSEIPNLAAPLTKLEIVGAACYFGTQLAFVTATKLTTAANAIFLQYTAPLWVLLFGWLFLREKPVREDWLTMPLIFAGLLLFLGEGLSLDSGLGGNLIAAFGGVLLAGTIVCARGQPGMPVRMYIIGLLGGVVIGLPSLLGETFAPADVAMVAYLGLFQMGLALVFNSLAMPYVPALEATLILALEPVLNPVWVFLVIGERPGPLTLLGAALVIGAVVARAVLGARTNGTEKRAQASAEGA